MSAAHKLEKPETMMLFILVAQVGMHIAGDWNLVCNPNFIDPGAIHNYEPSTKFASAMYSEPRCEIRVPYRESPV